MGDLVRESLRRRLRTFLLAWLEQGRLPEPPLKDQEAYFLALIQFQPLDRKSLAKIFQVTPEYIAQLSARLERMGLCQNGSEPSVTTRAEVVLDVFTTLRFPVSEEALNQLSQYEASHTLGDQYGKILEKLINNKIAGMLAESAPRRKRPPKLEDYFDAAEARCALAESERIPYGGVRKKLKLA